jgi:hypothetical protein
MKRGRRLSNVRILVFLGVMAAFWVSPGITESACGAAASSCKNCHEVKGEMRVNDKGDYHTQHAFGDFCVFCHSGNTAATTKVEAHEGMVKPLDNLEQSCASCHPDDFEKKAKGYGAVIKPKGKSGGGSAAGTGSGSAQEGKGTLTAKSTSTQEESYEIPHPTPDPSAVKPEDIRDLRISYAVVKEEPPVTKGDWILINSSLAMLFIGFPLLNRLFGKKKHDGARSHPMQKDAMDEGMA